MRVVFPILLNAYGFHRNFSRVMASAPFMYGGLNIRHFYDIQGQQKIKFFTMHLKRQDTTGDLMLIALQNMQLSIGTSSCFLHQSYDTYAHLLSNSWMKQLLEYIDSRQVTIDLTRLITFMCQRLQDKAIMQVLTQHFTKSELVLINRARIHLQLYFLSDMTSFDGRSVLPNIVDAINYRTSSWKRPTQTMPLNAHTLWKKSCTCIQSHLRTHRLGKWIRHNQQFRWWSNISQTSICFDNSTYYNLTSGRYGDYFATTHEKSQCYVNVDVVKKRGKLIICGSESPVFSIDESPSSTLNKCFESHELTRRIEKKICRLIKKNRLIYGSDTTFQNGYGAFAWGVLDRDNSTNTFLRSHAPLHGHSHQNHSTRGELFGLLGCLRHIHYLHAKYQISMKKKIPIYIYTDSAASISILKRKVSYSTKIPQKMIVTLRSKYAQPMKNSKTLLT